MFEDNQELLNEFVIESREGLAEIESDLLAIEAGGDTIDVDLVNKVFRAIHSIKGAAGFMGLATIGELSHALENVLSMIRSGELKPSPGKTTVLLEGADVLRALIEDIEHSDECDTTSNVRMLERVANGEDVESELAASSHNTNTNLSRTSSESDERADCVMGEVSAEFGIPVCHPQELPFTVTPEVLKKCADGRNWLYTMEFDLLADDEFAGDIVDLSRRIGDTCDIVDARIDREALGGIDQPLPCSLPCLLLVSSVLNPNVFARFWRLPENGLFLVSEQHCRNPFKRRKAPAGSVEVKAPAAVTSSALAISAPIPSDHSTRPVHQSEPASTIAPLNATATPASAPSVTAAPKLNVASASPDVATVTPSSVTPSSVTPSSATPSSATPGTAARKPGGTNSQPNDVAPRSSESAPRPDANIRVPVAVLDQLMNLAGELVLGRNQLLQTISNRDQRMLE